MHVIGQLEANDGIPTMYRRAAPWMLGIALLSCVAGAAMPEPTQSIDAIRRAAAGLVRAQLGGVAGRAIVTPAELDTRLRLARCRGPLDLTLPQDGAPRAQLIVRVACPGRGWSLYVPVAVEADIPVLVLQRAVAAGTRLGAGDVVPGTRRMGGVFSQYLADVGGLAGQHAKRALPAGAVLVADMLAPDPLVLRGQQVTLVASLGGLEVRAPGRALTDAVVATRVRVQNLSSQRIVEGIVESADTVRVAP